MVLTPQPVGKKPKVVVIGGGISGSMTALAVEGEGAFVTLIAPLPPRRSRSASLRDGIDAALDSAGGDSPSRHALDTIACGEGLADADAVRGMCERAPAIAHFYDRMGVMFTRDSQGLMAQASSLGSSARRMVLAGPRTGLAAISALDSSLRGLAAEGRIALLEGWEFLSLILDDAGSCRGAVAMSLRNMEVRAFAADAVVLCSGGYAGIFGRHSTCPESDGAAAFACFEQGAAFANPEFIQFHPFAIALADKMIPVADALIAAGARPCPSRDGKQGLLEGRLVGGTPLPTREALARESWGAPGAAPRGDGAGPFLDLSPIERGWLIRNFGEVMEIYRRTKGEDPLAAPMELSAAAHISLGGIRVGADHSSDIPGLFAAGGAACLYHGAGLIAGNEILASSHGGIVAGRCAAEFALGRQERSDSLPSALMDSAKRREEDANARLAAQDGKESAHLISRELGDLLFASCSVARDDARLRAAADGIEAMGERVRRAAPSDRSAWANNEVPFMRRLKRRVGLARLIVRAALARNESRGAHFKPATPLRDDGAWLAATVAKMSGESLAIEHHPIEQS